MPGDEPGALAVEVLGLELADLYGLLQRDTTGVNGELGAEPGHRRHRARAHVPRDRRGWARAGSAISASPFVQGVVNYADRRLDANLNLWRTGENILEVEAHLPMDLGFTGVEQRRVEGRSRSGPTADSVDLGILEALTPAIRRVQGRLAVDVEVGRHLGRAAPRGQRRDPERVPWTSRALGVRFGAVHGRRACSRATRVLLRDVRITSGGGDLAVGGSIRLEDLSRPLFDLDLQAQQFLAMDVRNFLTLVGHRRPAAARPAPRGPPSPAT